MKKSLSVIFVGGLLIFVALTPQKRGESEEIVSTEVLPEVEQVEEVHILTDEELSKLYSYKQDVRKKDDSIVELSQADAWALMKLSRSEDGDIEGDEGVDAQLAVMNVAMNRLKSEEFPNSIPEIIYAPMQFAVISDGNYEKAVPNVNSHLALARLEKGEDISQGALYFEASSNSSESWHSQHRQFLFENYGQRFYK